MAHRLSLSTGRLLALVAVVAGLHAVVADRVAEAVVAWREDAALPGRLQVAYVREMQPSEPPAARSRTVPPAAAAAPRAPRSPREPIPPVAPSPAASAPAAVAQAGLELESAPDPMNAATDATRSDVAAEALAALASPPLTAAVSAAVPVPAGDGAVSTPSTVPAVAPSLADAGGAAAASSGQPADNAAGAPVGPPFAWPASTRLSYRLSGQYRGEVHGRAQVEWVLAAPRYQVHLDVSVGLPIAPLFSRRMSSDGRLTATGLRPERYDEVSQMAFRERRQQRLLLEDDGVQLADGRRWSPPTQEGPPITVQDSASQFVQLSYLFTVNPGLLTPGQTVSFPLALPRRVEPWVYEVVGADTQFTPFGALQTFHVRPRPGTRRGNDLLAEAWFAPQLAYLPVRIRIEQDAEVFIDLVLDRRPELAAAPR